MDSQECDPTGPTGCSTQGGETCEALPYRFESAWTLVSAEGGFCLPVPWEASRQDQEGVEKPESRKWEANHNRTGKGEELEEDILIGLK